MRKSDDVPEHIPPAPTDFDSAEATFERYRKVKLETAVRAFVGHGTPRDYLLASTTASRFAVPEEHIEWKREQLASRRTALGLPATRSPKVPKLSVPLLPSKRKRRR